MQHTVLKGCSLCGTTHRARESREFIKIQLHQCFLEVLSTIEGHQQSKFEVESSKFQHCTEFLIKRQQLIAPQLMINMQYQSSLTVGAGGKGI
jgi:hypothetical protein